MQSLTSKVVVFTSVGLTAKEYLEATLTPDGEVKQSEAPHNHT